MKALSTKPFFTIVIPTLNEEANILNLLNDLTKQTNKDFCVVVVDGESKDKTQHLVKSFTKIGKRVKLKISDKKNVSYQRNIGAQESKSEWIIFMDADNRIPNYYIQGLRFNAEMYNPDILSTWMSPDTNTAQDRATAMVLNNFIELSKNTINPYILESMILVKKKSFDTLGGFDTEIGWHEGGDLLRRAKKKKMQFEFVKSPKYTYSFRRLRKSGAYKMLINVIEMEISRIVKNEKIDRKKAKKLYPMKGGDFYDVEKISKKTIGLFKDSLNSWKSFFD